MIKTKVGATRNQRLWCYYQGSQDYFSRYCHHNLIISVECCTVTIIVVAIHATIMVELNLSSFVKFAAIASATSITNDIAGSFIALARISVFLVLCLVGVTLTEYFLKELSSLISTGHPCLHHLH